MILLKNLLVEVWECYLPTYSDLEMGEKSINWLKNSNNVAGKYCFLKKIFDFLKIFFLEFLKYMCLLPYQPKLNPKESYKKAKGLTSKAKYLIAHFSHHKPQPLRAAGNKLKLELWNGYKCGEISFWEAWATQSYNTYLGPPCLV